MAAEQAQLHVITSNPIIYEHIRFQRRSYHFTQVKVP